jgi:hypothetical protein
MIKMHFYVVLLIFFNCCKLARVQTTRIITYSYTGVTQFFTVPYNVFSINVTLIGASGGHDYCIEESHPFGGSPGHGGYVRTELIVSPQSTLCVYVGSLSEVLLTIFTSKLIICK